MAVQSGRLAVISTPIGNLGDMSPRALEVLSAVDAIAAEDTRHSRKLLRHFGIDRPCIALHEHNERSRMERLVDRLRAGQALALVSDAGTPVVSDPGYHLVRAVHEGRWPADRRAIKGLAFLDGDEIVATPGLASWLGHTLSFSEAVLATIVVGAGSCALAAAWGWRKERRAVLARA